MIDEKSEAYRIWKSFYGVAYFKENNEYKTLLYPDSHSNEREVDDIALLDLGEFQYLSWTETLGFAKLIVMEVRGGTGNRKVEWTILEQDCFFRVNKWTDQGLFFIYANYKKHYAGKVVINKNPDRISLDVIELSEMLCIKKNWIVGHKGYGQESVSLFNLKTFSSMPSVTKRTGISERTTLHLQ
jgi:hypothetical protein